ncbi:His Phos 2 domain containing protein [Trichuris trichiura]|uniref:His Phos 2 domain containing protein n=1 Tax=Trichuris trichiura TaxID=36087 RepID=A0A077ZM03_TRITR|nr:His Phos 2 domain containing protein [Trichuris trichiura]
MEKMKCSCWVDFYEDDTMDYYAAGQKIHAIPRAIRSGELVFKGMFPETIAFKDCKGCVKIPIEVIPAENDTMLDLNYANCPYPYRPPLVSCVEIPGKERLTKKHEDVLMQIAKIIKRKPRTMDNYGLHDALLSYRHHGSMKSHLPDWARSDDFYNALSKLISESKTAYVMCQEYQLLRGSNLFKRIADQLSEAAKTNKSESSLKFAGYSAHDFTLIALLVDWDFYIAELDPQFGACIMVELHKIRGQYVVQVWYKQGHYKGPFPVKIKDCDMNCPLEKFVKLAEQLSSIDMSNRDLLTNIRQPMTEKEAASARPLADRWLPRYEESIEAPNPAYCPEKIKVWASPLGNMPIQGEGQSEPRSSYVPDCMDMAFMQAYNQSLKKKPNAVRMNEEHVKAAFIYFEKEKRKYEARQAEIEAEAADDDDVQASEARLKSHKITLSIPDVPADLELALLEYWLEKSQTLRLVTLQRGGRFEVYLTDDESAESYANEGPSTSGQKQKLKTSKRVDAVIPEAAKQKPESRQKKKEGRTAVSKTIATDKQNTLNIPAESNGGSKRRKRKKLQQEPNDANLQKAEAKNKAREQVVDANVGKAKRRRK